MFTAFKNLSASSIFAFAFFLTSGVTLARLNSAVNFSINMPQNDDFAAKHAKDLQNRLGLTEDQKSQVENILFEYRNNILNNNPGNSSVNNQNNPRQAANDKIISLLDESQKAAFAQMGKEWWDNINQEIGTTNTRH